MSGKQNKLTNLYLRRDKVKTTWEALKIFLRELYSSAKNFVTPNPQKARNKAKYIGVQVMKVIVQLHFCIDISLGLLQRL